MLKLSEEALSNCLKLIGNDQQLNSFIQGKQKRKQRSDSPNKVEALQKKAAGLALTLDQKRLLEADDIKAIFK